MACDCAPMLRLVTTLLCRHCQWIRRLPPLRAFSNPGGTAENQVTVEALYDLSVDIQKIRQLKGWVLHQSPAYVSETASLLRDMGAEGPMIARVLELYPEAVLCSPEQQQAQRELWRSICPRERDLVGIIEKFPASFFTSSHHANQRANIDFFQSLHLNKRIVTKLMASAPQSFSCPVGQNKEMVCTLQQAYLELGGDAANMKIWLQKLLSQNPFVLLKPPEVLRDNLLFLRDRGFTTSELLRLLSKLRGYVVELNPDSMRHTLAYSQETLGCSEAELRDMVLNCPALLYYPEVILAERFEGLLRAGVTMAQITQTPTVLELTTQIVSYRIQTLRSYGYDVRTGSLQALNGTKKDFEMSSGKLQLRRERPLFNPVAPLKVDD
ncbi:transcription termination factor 2, mitochondrial [Oncorhynchus tshawytscha]|uniref:Mitochondrial transcription termination factor 2 n=1 Tax=Oncorhynchus tshawytscha TaxID=74940 RepID=A0AAZ3S7W7_ONCTS|nr:transcription termination factor 2, mitochondrial [Oncorhynchus tshawytscha]XP_024235580.1 transcription termination factor 2, mitochondrial [Oncorhynchus tshawytscha]